MVQFAVNRRTAIGRCGKCSAWSKKSSPIEFDTPQCLIYTRGGHIPHLTWDVAEKQLKLSQSPVYQISLPSLFESLDTIERFGKGIVAFCRMPKDAPVHLSMYDPLAKLETGYNNTKSVAIWTKTGRRSIDTKQLKRILAAFQPDSFQTLADWDTPSDCANKRLTKAINRTVDFHQELFDEENNDVDYPSPFVSLCGGISEFHRSRCAQELGQLKVARGFSLEFFQQRLKDPEGGPLPGVSSLEPLIQQTLTHLPSAKPRLINGAFNPTEVVQLTGYGIDLFDSSFATKLADAGQGFRLADDFPHNPAFTVVDFNDKRYADDFTPVFADCQCYTCAGYTKGYVQHLCNTKEMLAQILLTMLRRSVNEIPMERDYRDAREALNEWNSQFWKQHNQLFERRKAEFIAQKRLILEPNKDPSAHEMSAFYKEFLDSRRPELSAYNREWYKRSFALLWPAFRLNMVRFIRRFVLRR